MQSGQQLLEETIAACQEIAEGLSSADGGSQDWEDSVTEIVEKFEKVSGTFFFKTMPRAGHADMSPRRRGAPRAPQIGAVGRARPGVDPDDRKRSEADREGRDEGGHPDLTRPVLVTGGAGSVGRRVVDRLVGSGRSVRVLDLPAMDFTGLEDRPGVEVVRGDITDADGVRRAVEGSGAVLHLGAVLPPNSERDRDLTLRVNVGGTRNLVDAIEQLNPGGRLVFTSSISTYGDTSADEPPVRVARGQWAIDIYAESKIEGEKLVRESSLTNAVVLRIAG